jgi:hypothetical protein
MVQLAGSDAGFESYLRRDVLESGSTEEQLYRVARTKVAVLRRVCIRSVIGMIVLTRVVG